MNGKVIGIIPARYESTRFPGKPIHPIAGKPLVMWVYEQASKARRLDEVVVATDDERIFDTVAGAGGIAVMTRSDHQTGTDRLAEAASSRECGLVVNIQGDEPLMDPELIDKAVERFSAIPDFKFGSAMTPIRNEEDIENPNIVKVVAGRAGQALYFSRYPIPFRRKTGFLPVYQHIGFYVYSKDFLLEYSRMAPTPLEQTECLEQLRALENGVRIDMIETEYRGIGVDMPEDVLRIEEEIARKGLS